MIALRASWLLPALLVAAAPAIADPGADPGTRLAQRVSPDDAESTGAGGESPPAAATSLGEIGVTQALANVTTFFSQHAPGGGGEDCGLSVIFDALRQEMRSADGVYVNVKPGDVRVEGTDLALTTAVTVQLPNGDTVESTAPIRLDMEAIAREAGLTRGGRRVSAARVVAERPNAVAAAVANRVGAVLDEQVRPQLEARAAAGGDPATYRKAVASLGGIATSFRAKRSGDFRLAAGQTAALSW